jgi:ubiquitin-activating enzyme E1
MDFVVAAANLRASIYGLEGSRDVKAIRAILSGIKVSPFVPRENIRIAANDAEAEAQAQNAHADQVCIDVL